MPAYFVPARNSRHRTACESLPFLDVEVEIGRLTFLGIALYRALLQQVPKISLPDDVVSGAGAVNPIKHLIRKGFRRNRIDTSPRLVVPALQNGYKVRSKQTSPLADASLTGRSSSRC